MIHGSFALMLLSFAAPAAGQTIEVGKADWQKMPQLAQVERPLPYAEMVGRVEQLLTEKQCRLRGQSPRRFDITVPYAVLVGPDGHASRIVVADMGCAPLETMVGNIVADRAQLGDFRPAASTAPKWYSSKINFTQQ